MGRVLFLLPPLNMAFTSSHAWLMSSECFLSVSFKWRLHELKLAASAAGTWTPGCGASGRWTCSGRNTCCRGCTWCTWLWSCCTWRGWSCLCSPRRSRDTRQMRSSPAASGGCAPPGRTCRAARPPAWWSCRSAGRRWAWPRRAAAAPAGPGCTARRWCPKPPGGCGSRCSCSFSAACWKSAPGRASPSRQWLNTRWGPRTGRSRSLGLASGCWRSSVRPAWTSGKSWRLVPRLEAVRASTPSLEACGSERRLQWTGGGINCSPKHVEINQFGWIKTATNKKH